MTRNLITATIAVLAASAAVLVAFDDASARGFRGAGASRGGFSRAVSHRAAMPRMSHRMASPRMGRMTAPRAGRQAMPRMSRPNVSQRNLGQASRLSRPAASRPGQSPLSRPLGRSPLAGANSGGRFDPRSARNASSPFNRGQIQRADAKGGGLPRPNLSQFDRSRNSPSKGANGLPKPNAGGSQTASNKKTGRFYDNMGGSPMNGTQQASNNPQQQANNTPPKQNNPPKGGDTSRPNNGQQILINWRNDFLRGVGGGLMPSKAGTGYSVCVNLAWCAAGAPPGLGAWLMAPAPGLESNLFGGFVDSFTPTDPKDPLSTPFDNSVRNAVKGAQSFDLNPFDSIANPPAAWSK